MLPDTIFYMRRLPSVIQALKSFSKDFMMSNLPECLTQTEKSHSQTWHFYADHPKENAVNENEWKVMTYLVYLPTPSPAHEIHTRSSEEKTRRTPLFFNQKKDRDSKF